jgi:hypothetical protein
MNQSFSISGRQLLRSGGIAAISGSWTATSLVAHGIVAGTAQLEDALFAVALAATYAGAWMFATARSRSQSQTLLRAAATTLTLGVIVLLLELPAAFHWLHWSRVFRYLSGEGTPDYTTSYVLDKELEFRRIPGLQWTARPYSDIEAASGLPRALQHPITFTYDRWGYRNAVEMSQADIVLVGDSFAEGWYVSDKETTAAVLGRRLKRPVANFGVAGYGTLQELRVVQGDAMRRNPRVLIWYFFEGNDLYDDQRFENSMMAPADLTERTPHTGGLSDLEPWNKRSFVNNVFRRLRRLGHPLVPVRSTAFQAMLPKKDGSVQPIYFGSEASVHWTGFEGERWAVATQAFQTGVRFARDRGVHVMLIFIPFKYRVYRDFITDPRDNEVKQWKVWPEYPAKFLDLCRTLNVPCVDTTPILKDAQRNNVMVYALTDTHWSADGHAIVAAELERRLKELRWVPEREGK